MIRHARIMLTIQTMLRAAKAGANSHAVLRHCAAALRMKTSATKTTASPTAAPAIHSRMADARPAILTTARIANIATLQTGVTLRDTRTITVALTDATTSPVTNTVIATVT